MSLFLGQAPKLWFRKPVLVRSSPLHSKGSSSSMLQTPPCFILRAEECGGGMGKLVIHYANEREATCLDKKVPLKLVYNKVNDKIEAINTIHGWLATLEDNILRLQDDFNPLTSDKDPKRIPLPPLVALPYCQTEIVSNVSMSSSSPEDEDCVVAVKFLGGQLSFCRPAQRNPEWINILVEEPCFFVHPRVMYSKKDDMFHLPASGGHFIKSWDLRKLNDPPKLQKLRYPNIPELAKTEQSTMDILVESPSTGETFLIKWFKKLGGEVVRGIPCVLTEALMVFKLDEEGNAVYTQNIGDLCIFLAYSEPFCVSASSFPGLRPNFVYIFDSVEIGGVFLSNGQFTGVVYKEGVNAPFFIPPLNIH